MKIVLEARKTNSTRRRNATQINAADDDLENGTDDVTDYSEDIPDDPDVTPEDNPEDFTEGIPDTDTGDDNQAIDTGENNPDADNTAAPDDTNDTPDYTEGMPDGDDGTDDAPAGQGTDANAASEPDPNAPAITAGLDTTVPADNTDQPATAPDDANAQADQAANPNEDEAPPEDFTAGMPDDDGTDNAPEGQGVQPADTAGDNANPDSDMPTDGQEDGLDADLNDTGEDDDPDSGAIQDSSDNGEDPKSISELDKKNNKNMLRRSYIELYKTIDDFIYKIDASDKESILATSTYSQVKTNLNNLKALVMEYIMQYYDKTDEDINLYNYNYFLQIMVVNLEMIRVYKDAEEKINKKDE